MAQTSEVKDDHSVVELIKQVAEQSAALARKELELAEAEVTVKAKRAGIGAGALGASGVIALFAVGALTAAAILGISTALAGWLAALIVGGAYAVIAGTMALVGAVKVKRASPPTPQAAQASVRQDVETVKARARAGRT
jgi:hypothetical protein